MLASETELTKMGFFPARALECYKESRNHVIINYLHIALLEQREAIVIIPLKNREYEMLRLPRVAVLYLLLKIYPVLQTGTVSEKELLQLQDIDSFLREVKDCKENIMIGEFQDNALTKEWLYYWKNNQIFEYDLNRQIKREVDAVQVRRELLRLLAIDEEVKNYA